VLVSGWWLFVNSEKLKVDGLNGVLVYPLSERFGYGKCGISRHFPFGLTICLFNVIPFILALFPAFAIADVGGSFLF